jgi:hypothetical protein
VRLVATDGRGRVDVNAAHRRCKPLVSIDRNGVGFLYTGEHATQSVGCDERPAPSHIHVEPKATIPAQALRGSIIPASACSSLAATVFGNRAQEGRKVRGWGGERRCLPVSFVMQHGIENHEELAHAGDER